jgi:hypothetical protein
MPSDNALVVRPLCPTSFVAMEPDLAPYSGTRGLTSDVKLQGVAVDPGAQDPTTDPKARDSANVLEVSGDLALTVSFSLAAQMVPPLKWFELSYRTFPSSS